MGRWVFVDGWMGGATWFANCSADVGPVRAVFDRGEPRCDDGDVGVGGGMSKLREAAGPRS